MSKSFVSKQGSVICYAVVVSFVGALITVGAATGAETPAVRELADGTLEYVRDERGNRVLDFSNCGYAGADRPIPDVPVKVAVAPAEGDDGPRIQAAIDRVSALPAEESGFRGAVLLAPGTFDVAGQLRIAASGVVLRGAGAGRDGTTIIATGQSRRPLIQIAGTNDRAFSDKTERAVVADYVPVGENRLQLDDTSRLRVGDTILITRPSTLEWIRVLGADAFGVAWKPGTRDIRWDRMITAIDGDTITLDAPITTAIEARFGGATVQTYEWPRRIEHVGIEDMRLAAKKGTGPFSTSNDEVTNVGTTKMDLSPFLPPTTDAHDEEHAWFGITIQSAQNTWVRRVEFRHFAGGAVALWENTKWATVEDCIALEPISELAGYRRRTFFTQGQLALFLRCWSEHGRHDFAVGHCAPGPNAFVNCFAANAHGDSGPVESWAAGVLYDNVRIDGAGLTLDNRWIDPPGAGWSAGNCVLWQCQAATVRCFRPPTANNWAIGVWGGLAGDGAFEGRSDFVRPISLYQGQLRARRGDDAAEHVSPGLVDPIGSTNPTIAEAAKFSAQSRKPARQLVDLIRQRFDRAPAKLTASHLTPDTRHLTPRSPITDNRQLPASPPPKSARMQLKNGWLVAGDKLLTGGSLQQGFWRGNIRPDEAASFGPAITRFVPGRDGTGFTDDLTVLASMMQTGGVAVFDHHYGLWYDRRRDDHTMVRQANANVAPPFYEQPFARTGPGTAWNGLRKYDLTRFNPWYWQRLCDFATLCDERGLVLIHQSYFQHNILEAGAHWADSPWRPSNNVNDTGLPEPPPYIGDKRIFLAEQFYDVGDPRRRALHRGYMRQCLDNFADRSNVIQMTSAEYSGPLEFTQFWLDTIIEWEGEQRERGGPHDVLIGLSAPKDVQDAILEDPQRGPHVDVIDIRYWTYTEGGELYAPKGGQNLAPRQHLRKTRQKPGGAAAIVKAVREYRTRYPDRAVTYFADMHCPSTRDGWAVLIAGGTLADVKLPAELAQAIPTMKPADDIVSGDGVWCLANPDGDYLVYSLHAGKQLEIKLPNQLADYRIQWIDSRTGSVSGGEVIAADQPHRLRAVTNVLWIKQM